jgi:16S rRNA (guanine527-N7)-methyltransferase
MGPVEDRHAALIRGAARFSVQLAAEAADAMLAYLDRVLEVNRTLNLTAIRDPNEGLARHLLDSLAFGLHVAAERPPQRVVDVGTGAGFPGVPIAIAWPSARVLLVDATRKKVHAVAAIVEGLGLPNVSVRWSRADELRGVGADAVVARAVGPVDSLLRASARLLAPRGCLVAWKSDRVPGPERHAGATAAVSAGMESLPDLEYELGAPRRLVRFRRVEEAR